MYGTCVQDPHTPSLEAITFVGVYVQASTRHRLSLVIIWKMKCHNDADEYAYWPMLELVLECNALYIRC